MGFSALVLPLGPAFCVTTVYSYVLLIDFDPINWHLDCNSSLVGKISLYIACSTNNMLHSASAPRDHLPDDRHGHLPCSTSR